jgi:hypothetical protein
MKEAFSWVSLIIGVLPGLTVILIGLGTPADLRQPFGIVAAAWALLAFVVSGLIKVRAIGSRKKALISLSFVFGLLGCLSLSSYWVILDRCVYTSSEHSPVFFPLWLDGRAKAEVENAGGRLAFYDRYGAGAVSDLVHSQAVEMDWTRSLLLSLISAGSFALGVSSGLVLGKKPIRRTRPIKKTKVDGLV